MLDNTLLVQIPDLLLKRLDYLWTFVLLMSRYIAIMSIVPGIGMGMRGLPIRIPAVMALSVASIITAKIAPVPPNAALLILGILGEVLFGLLIGLMPAIIIACAQTAGQFASTSMGLNAGNQIDPTFGINSSDLARLYGDLTTILFLFLGGHYIVVYAAAGLTHGVPPGEFFPNDASIFLLVDRASRIFEAGFLLAAPVIVALLLTQFVMGLVSKAVPTVNIFIVSFPLTIGIGLILSLLALPDMMVFLTRELGGLDNLMSAVVESGKR